MLATLKKENSAKILTFLFVIFTLWWGYLHLFGASDLQNQIFGASYGLLALAGAVFGFLSSLKWGGWKSLLGRSIMMFSLGLFAQEFGQIMYSIYTFFLHVEIPYPSLGDLGYFGSIPLYIYGTFLLARVSGVRVQAKSLNILAQAILIPLILLVASYFLFLRGYVFEGSTPLIIFLDFGYPFGEAIYISLAILTYLLSRKVLGGVMRSKVLYILFSLVIQFFSDYTFLYLSRYGSISAAYAAIF
jgi:hypothetical protein